jgi:allantoinase
MAEYDLLIRGAFPLPAIGIANGLFAGFEAASARAEVDATGLIVLPGVIDAHVHFNEPGRTEWEGWATGSRAAVAGGVTMVCDMPLNSTPPVVTVEAFEAKRRAAEARAICDFALWGGLIPGHVDDLEPLAAAGVIGFKAFMAHSGIDDFPKVDLATLRAGMSRAARLGLTVAVHAEFDRPRDSAADAAAAAAEAPASLGARAGADAAGAHSIDAAAAGARGTSVRDYLASRPIDSECDAIRAAIDIAADTGCALHVVHVSSGRGVSIIAEARARGVDVTGETCPHYLVFTDADMERLGAVAKCAPPFRDAAERAALIDHVRGGRVDTIGSDHSPSPWTLKTHDDFFRVWGGISGIQHLLPLLLSGGASATASDSGSGRGAASDASLGVGLEPALVARLTAENVAERFRLPGKGRLAVGFDADLTLVDLGGRAAAEAVDAGTRHGGDDSRGGYEVTAESLFYRHRISPYVGRHLSARVCRTIRRGQTVFDSGRITADAGGRLLLPQPHAL